VPVKFWDGLSANDMTSRLMNFPPSFGEKVARIAAFFSASTGEMAYRRTVAQWLDEAEIPLHSAGPEQRLQKLPLVSLPQQMMCWDLQSYLPDDILVKVDRAAMAYGLETRVPFLDHRIVEFSLNTPMHYKIRGGQSKWLLRNMLARYVPNNLFERPKQGFSLPLADWLRGPLREWAEDLLSNRALGSSGLLDVNMVRETWKEHLTQRFNHQRGLWTILMLQTWIKSQ
jgi:asparagine synthase (glutamine-hydrolysing)